ncbi:MAG: hypothetical protein SFV81_09115, partial [Pirellulaceae bacterium]|nr:hypothetical protein [Pirellulaceae bacterium]
CQCKLNWWSFCIGRFIDDERLLLRSPAASAVGSLRKQTASRGSRSLERAWIWLVPMQVELVVILHWQVY